MPVDSKHPLYQASLAQWERCRDAYNGQDVIKAKGEAYLPKPGGLNAQQYEAYKGRALFFEATGRTIDGFVGAISRKDPVIEAPAQLDAFIQDATTDGLSLIEMQKRVCLEMILTGRGGLLLDWNEKLNRPYLVMYPAESITNWEDDKSLIVLFETVYERDEADKFKLNVVNQYRELALIDGVYTVTIWRKEKINKVETDKWLIHETHIPTMRGRTIAEIPFEFLTPLGKTSRVEKPPLLGLVNVSLSHYMNSADYEHGLHFTGLPTLYVTGLSDSDGPIHIGSLSAIVVADSNAKIGYAEFSGKGLSSLKEAMEGKKHDMAILGAAVFQERGHGVEAAETARIRSSGEVSLLSGVVTAAEEALKAVLQLAAEWQGSVGTVEITLNREYVDTTMDGQTLTGLVAAYQAGALSLEQFLYNLQQGELLAPDTDIEEEAEIVRTAQLEKQKMALEMAKSKSGQGLDKPKAENENTET
jgi:hypothetical protein